MIDEFVEHPSSSSLLSPQAFGTSNPFNSSGSGGVSGSGSGIPSGGMGMGMAMGGVNYAEGFEEDGNEVEGGEGYGGGGGGEELEALEPAFMPKLLPDGTSPIFSLSHVQFSLPSQLLSLQVNSNILIMALHPLSLILIDLARPAELVNVELPKPAVGGDGKSGAGGVGGGGVGPVIKALFGDPGGRHLLITVTTGDVFYLSTSNLSSPSSTTTGSTQPSTRKPRPLRLRHQISCVAWSPLSASTSSSSSSSTNSGTVECLLGSPDGTISTLVLPPNDDIFNLKSVSLAKSFERDHIDLYTLPETSTSASTRQGVTGLQFGFWETLPSTTTTGGTGSSSARKTGAAGERKVWAVITSRERVYEVQVGLSAGAGAGWSMVGKGEFQELPGNVGNSSMLGGYWQTLQDVSRRSSLKGVAQPSILAPGLYHFTIPPTSTSSVMTQPSLLPYDIAATAGAGTSTFPLAVLVTEFHFVLLFAERIVGISRLTERIVWEEGLNLKNSEKPKGLVSDHVNKTFWFYTDQALYEIVVKDEDRDVWKAKLDKGSFDIALKYAKNPRQTDIIKSRQADHFFDQKRYLQAAQTYAQCSRSFEFVALRFVDADEKDALRIYLSERLDQTPKSDLTQRMMLATWLVEIYLSKCNTLEDIIAAEAATSDVDSLRTELMLMEEDLRNFMTTYQQNLDRTVIYELIQSHGRTDIYLFYAGLLKDNNIVLQHYITEEMYLQAIDVLNRQDSLELYYRSASILMRHVPKETVDCWLKQSALDVRRLIPALLTQQHDASPTGKSHCVRYLSAIIRGGSTDHIVHNLLVTLLARDTGADDGPLLDYLKSAVDDPMTDKPYYDLDYALRLCKQQERILPCVYIYSKMGLYESSVDLALEKGNLELAKLNADKADDDDALRKKLWLKIARYVVQDQKDIKSAMKFLEQTDLLKIEDILPFFPDFTVIDDFKDEICNALEDYSAHIESLKAEMDEATKSADNIKADIENLKNRFITIDANERCSHCQTLLVTRQFYAFPCQHVFHADCLITLAKQFLPSASLRRIVHLQNELIRLSKPLKSQPPQDPRSRGLISSHQNSTDNVSIASGSAMDPTTLLLGGSRKLLAAGDKLRELIVPDVLANAVSVVGGMGANGKKSKKLVAQDPRDQERVEQLREEIDKVLAASCVLCEGAVATLDRPFITAADEDGSWDI